MEEFLSFIADILEVDKNTLTLETSQDDVETWDSLMQLRLLGEIGKIRCHDTDGADLYDQEAERFLSIYKGIIKCGYQFCPT